MSENIIDPRKPRLWLRLFVVIVLILCLVAALAYTKFLQIQEQINMGSQLPPPISVTVSTAGSDQWNRRVSAVGTLVSTQGIAISSEVPGLIGSVNFNSGQEVQQGALLLELDNRSQKANLESAQARLNAAQRRYRRLNQLKGQSFATANEIEEQESLVEIAEAEVNEARVALDKTRIYAPFSGKLGIRRVNVGQYLESPGSFGSGSTITFLEYLDKLHLDFGLPEDNFNDLKVGQSIDFKVRSYPDRDFKARVQAWDQGLNPTTRNIVLRAEVDNRERLLAPGMFAQMEVNSRIKIPVVTVPETAIFYNIYGEAVYILEKPGASESDPEPDYRLAARQVDVAYRENGIAGVSSGIAAGDIVVTAGQLKLYPSLRVTIVDDVPAFDSTGN